MHRAACDIRVEASYMIDAPSGQWLEEIREGVAHGTITEESLMHLVLLPLTYHGKERQQTAIRQCVELAKKLPDRGQRNFALAGILTFTDKIIDENMKKYVEEALEMTEVGNRLMEKGRQEGDYERARKTAFKMYEKKYSLEHIADIIEFPISTIQEWLAESRSKA